MDPKVLMELSRLVQQLPPEKLNQMQTLMHNMMAGHNVQREMEEFEKTLPPGFREKVAALMAGQMGTVIQPMSAEPTTAAATPSPATEAEHEAMDLRHARLTILRAVAEGKIPPEDAEKLLFPEG